MLKEEKMSNYFVNIMNHNPIKNILQKLKKSSKIRQDQNN